LRQGAHHVFRKQKDDGFNDVLTALIRALESSDARESTPVAAYEILRRLKGSP
jgi:hypothetical protein